ncbi:MAG TPA: alpha/beta hydrolase, partial [Deltaproteobacteria bacterium]|nr:alpha/beta hydrolase [Deltaproteobacteria bacterium]
MRPVILFAHGSGAGHDHPWLQRWHLLLSTIGDVVPLTYSYMQEGRRIPSPVEALETEHVKQATAAARGHRNRPLLLAGKSLGGRVSVRVAQRTPALATVVFGYPLISSG